MTAIDTRNRTTASEIMDDFSLEGETLRDALDKIAVINKFLGGNKLTLNGVRKLLAGESKSEVVTIVDIGCGNGDMLREIADFGTKEGWNFELIGIDANQFTVNHAQQLSRNYNNIEIQCVNIFEIGFDELNCDIALCTLTLHHFSDTKILKLVDIFAKHSTIGVVINDLHRSSISYRLFQALCFVFNLNEMSREDGLVSILRGFKRKDLVVFAEKLNLKKYSIRWKWAFRYQWIISNI